MIAGAAPRPSRALRLLVVDGGTCKQQLHEANELARLLAPGDLVVVNDAATLPASLPARDASGAELELRLVGALEPGASAIRFTAAVLGAGDHRTRTEDRPPPPPLARGDVLRVGHDLLARVLGCSAFSERLVDVELVLASNEAAPRDRVWAALYRTGRPVQYAHVPDALALWDVQNAWAGRPWAVEMPSAGRALGIATLLALRVRGVEVAWVTHAAGLSATGDPRIDARLPLPERFDVPEDAARAVLRCKSRGGRVVAIGTSVVRALESAARAADGRALTAASGTTDLVIDPNTPLALVDGLLTGVHERATSHFSMLGAFASAAVLAHALATSEREGLLGHELGDAWLVWGARHARRATPPVARSDNDASTAPSPGGTSATFAA